MGQLVLFGRVNGHMIVRFHGGALRNLEGHLFRPANEYGITGLATTVRRQWKLRLTRRVAGACHAHQFARTGTTVFSAGDDRMTNAAGLVSCFSRVVAKSTMSIDRFEGANRPPF